MDLYDTPGEVVIRVETGDVDPRNIEIRLAGRMLTLVGKQEAVAEEGQRSILAGFKRSIVLPSGIVATKAAAKYKGKRLVVRIPKEATENSSALDRPVKL